MALTGVRQTEAPITPETEIDHRRFLKFSTDFFLENGVSVSFAEARQLFADYPTVTNAIQFAEAFHGEQTRRNGKSYTEGHLIPLACLFGRYCFYAGIPIEEGKLITAVLHDVVEDTEATTDDVEKFFGPDIASSVDILTKPPKTEIAESEERASVYRDQIICATLETEKTWLPELKCLDNILNVIEDIVRMKAGVDQETKDSILEYLRKSQQYYAELFDPDSPATTAWHKVMGDAFSLCGAGYDYNGDSGMARF